LAFIEQNKLLSSGDRVLVGVSGGPDSVALLHLLHSVKEEFKLEITVAHLNHMIRGKEADKDEKFVQDICQNLSIGFFSKSVKVERIAKDKKITVEEAGREERYKFFFYLGERLGINKIALAHHMDDDVETILMRFIRGTGIKGLRGIASLRDDGVIRPFLSIRKEEILKYCSLYKIPSRLDKTNLESKYHRNKLRLELIPYLESINPNFAKGVSQLGAISAEYYDFIQQSTEEAMERTVVDGKIDIKRFKGLHVCVKKEILMELLQRMDKNVSLAYHHIEIILDKLIHLQVLPRQVYENLGSKSKSSAFDYELIQNQGENLYLRNRREGDRIDPIGMKGTKKIKDLFIDKKVPADIRWKIPLLCIDEQVIWVVGYHKSRRFQLTENTKNVLVVSFDDYKEAEKNGEGY